LQAAFLPRALARAYRNWQNCHVVRKLFTSFFIIYTVVLLTQPCQDFQAAALELKKTVSSISDSIPSDSEAGPETCSPFCICGCCGLSVVHHGPTTTAISERIEFTENTLVSIYYAPFTNSFIDPIWQPPKV